MDGGIPPFFGGDAGHAEFNNNPMNKDIAITTIFGVLICLTRNMYIFYIYKNNIRRPLS
jgi:hypothetical protein